MIKQYFAITCFLNFLFFSLTAEPIRVELISIPVSGTHLASKCIDLLLTDKGGWNRIFKGAGACHQAAVKKNINKVLKNKYKVIFNIRDPRDRIVSYAFKIKKFRPDLTISIQDLALKVITHYGKLTYDYLTHTLQYKNMGDFSEYYALYLPWLDYPDLLVIYFENLVGPKAGGSKSKQVQEIKKIADFLNISVSEERINEIADNLYGGTVSFRNPKIGLWRDYFTHQHKVAFKNTSMKQFLIDFGYEVDDKW